VIGRGYPYASSRRGEEPPARPMQAIEKANPGGTSLHAVSGEEIKEILQ